MSVNLNSVNLVTAGGINAQAIPLKDGSNVMVRVLQDKGSGNFLVSFAGNRFNVKSEAALKPGQSFVAQMNFKDGKVLLTPQEKIQLSGPEKIISLADENGNLNSVLAQMLSDYGLVPDSITVKIMQFFQQTGLSFNKDIMKKAREIGLHFPGKEKMAAEIAANLMAKGAKADVETVKKLLMSLTKEFSEETYSEQENSEFYQNEENSNFQEKDKNSSEENLSEQNKTYKTDEKKAVLEELYGPLPAENTGLLTFINHVKNNTDHHWILLPYEWNFTRKNGNSVSASGFIRMLLNTSLKTVEKISVNCRIPSLKSTNDNEQWTNYFFVLYLNLSKVKEIRFCTLPALLTSKISYEEKRLGELISSGMNLGDSVTVTYSTLAFTEGLFADSEMPSLIERIV